MNRGQHDCAHRMAVRLLWIVAPALRGEEQKEFYTEAMSVLMEELNDFEERRRREADRLAPGAKPK
jgi:hypothetical protein